MTNGHPMDGGHPVDRMEDFDHFGEGDLLRDGDHPKNGDQHRDCDHPRGGNLRDFIHPKGWLLSQKSDQAKCEFVRL